MKHLNRRDLLKSLLPAAAVTALPGAAAWAVTDPYARAGGANLRLGLAAYSFREYFDTMKGKPSSRPAEEQITMTDFIDYCAKHGVGGAELTSYFMPQDGAEEYYAGLRFHAHLNGVAVSGTAIGNNFSHPAGPEREEQMAYTKSWIDRAALMGAPHIRVFAGKHPKGVSEEEAEKYAIECLEEAGEYAGEKGVFLGIENHDSIGESPLLLRIVKAVKNPWVGVNLDTGNFRTEDPYKDIAEAAPYALNVQVKVQMRIQKQPADLDRIFKILREAGYQGYVTLEYEESDNPFEAVPPLLDKMRALCDY